MKVEEMLIYLEDRLQQLQQENRELHEQVAVSEQKVRDAFDMIMKTYSPPPQIDGLAYDQYGGVVILDEKVLTESLMNKGDFKTLVELSQIRVSDPQTDERLRRVLSYVNSNMNKTEEFI